MERGKPINIPRVVESIMYRCKTDAPSIKTIEGMMAEKTKGWSKEAKKVLKDIMREELKKYFII